MQGGLARGYQMDGGGSPFRDILEIELRVINLCVYIEIWRFQGTVVPFLFPPIFNISGMLCPIW